jgi:NADH dehydrogenase [ubiquinone] 1 alpha subcomplex assembly factor 2
LSSNRNRMRRIAKYATEVPYADVASQISPAWHQWLRHTRRDPPSLTEQAQDILRQEQLKVLAAQADARWAEKPSVLDPPRNMGQAMVSTEGSDGRMGVDQREYAVGESKLRQNERPKTSNPEINMQNPGEKRDSSIPGVRTKGSESIARSGGSPWEKARGPGEGWQPQAWDPDTLRLRIIET